MNGPTWFLDELAHAGPEHRDPAYVATYDRKAATDPTDDVALLRGLRLGETSVVVDLGAGTGTFALAAAPYCGRLVAVDVSPAMLASMETKSSQLGLRNVEVAQAGFLSYEHQGAPADFVYSRNALHHLPDFWKALALSRIANMMRPGGLFILRDLIFSFEPDDAPRKIEAWLAGADERPTGGQVGWTRAELEEHLRVEYSTFTWLLEPMLQRAGFDIDQAQYSPSGIYAAYTCVRRPADR
ncbi:MAG TPA: class I SAM-dependent methyltransferase [Ktedonobacterales bacterium]|jgi:ubiquinone/menaquinone biosynthesis C-methylase UbiE|nr:class I SAM-dependent methyltransferase [Ktedonobacterales bacterium]